MRALPALLRGWHRACCSGVALCSSLLLASTATTSHAAPVHLPDITVHGSVLDSSGNPVPMATVIMNNVPSTANQQGQYSITVHTGGNTQVHLWAPGFEDELFNLQLPSSGGRIGWNFSGHFGLHSAFRDPQSGASLSGLPVQTSALTKSVSFYGSAGVPLQDHFAVTLPNGHVARYHLTVNGSSFSGTLPFRATGTYRVEINNTAAMSVFNVIVFHGVPPALPTDLPFRADPPQAKSSRLAKRVLNLINAERFRLHLPRVHFQHNLLQAAQLHTADIIRGGYAYTHPHIGSDGSTPAQRVQRAGLRTVRVGEDVSIGANMRMAVLSWLTSPIHLANIIGKYKYVGIGVKPSGTDYIVTIDFAR